MSKAQRFFRYLWRANAVLIFLGTVAISVSIGSLLVSELWRNTNRHQDTAAAPPVVGSESGEQLYLGQVVQIAGTDTLRGELLASGSGKGLGSSGYGSDVRNVLFLDGQSKTARWLLPDSRHVISQSIDVRASDEGSSASQPIAEVLLIKAIGSDAEADIGRLMLLDPTGQMVTTISEGVRAVNHAQLSLEGHITVLYERNRKYVLATFDASSLAKLSEDELAVPQLK